MTTLIYDGSFNGLLTAIFETHEYKFLEAQIMSEDQFTQPLFGNTHTVITNANKALRVQQKLKELLTTQGFNNFYAVFLSEELGFENKLLAFTNLLLQQGKGFEYNYANPNSLYVKQMARKVFKERHRMEAFVRFKQTKDDLYYSFIEPDYNVLPLLAYFFAQRFANQQWLIYDNKRNYGLFFDKQQITNITLNIENKEMFGGHNALFFNIHPEQEMQFEKLWQQYFKSTNIEARKNTKLHTQYLPKRYWKYLTEKQAV